MEVEDVFSIILEYDLRSKGLFNSGTDDFGLTSLLNWCTGYAIPALLPVLKIELIQAIFSSKVRLALFILLHRRHQFIC